MKTNSKEILLKEFDYTLPQEQITEEPSIQRDSSKLLIYKNGIIKEDVFRNLVSFLPQNATLVLNNTKVIEARLFFQKQTGGNIELFCLEPFEPHFITAAMVQTKTVKWRCLIGGASKWKRGQVLQKKVQATTLTCTLTASYIDKENDSFIIEFSWDGGHLFSDVLQEAGVVPLPPYIKRKSTKEDKDRYQTIFARHQGSVAAPTAALHFTPDVFTALQKKEIHSTYITLHVGAGTFKPVKTEYISGHRMHAEQFSVSDRFLQTIITSEKIIAVGTTSLRTLESLYWLGVKLITDTTGTFIPYLEQWEPYELEEKDISYTDSLTALVGYLHKNGQTELHGRTRLLIIPGYKFHSAAAIITNFHQPRSTLLLLIAAFIGEDWKKVYKHALEKGYRFLSYGDSSLLWTSPQPSP